MASAVQAGLLARPVAGRRHGGDLPRSQIWGSRSVRLAAVRAHGPRVEERRLHARTVVRSASFFQKLAQLFSSSDDSAPAWDEQVMALYEINEGDRKSPAYLPLQLKRDGQNCLGDLVPYTNKVYGPSGKDLYGISAGLCTVIEGGTSKGVRYETTYTHYVGDYGQIAAMGAYFSTGDSEMVITGGTGIFKGARGIVKIHNIVPPVKLLYTYYISGIQKLPEKLSMPAVPLPEEVIAKHVPATSSA